MKIKATEGVRGGVNTVNMVVRCTVTQDVIAPPLTRRAPKGALPNHLYLLASLSYLALPKIGAVLRFFALLSGF